MAGKPCIEVSCIQNIERDNVVVFDTVSRRENCKGRIKVISDSCGMLEFSTLTANLCILQVPIIFRFCNVLCVNNHSFTQILDQ